MRNFRQSFKKILTFTLFIALFTSWNFALAESTETNATHHSQNNINWPGIYNGFVPCDDCNGVKTTLALNPNSTYLLITQFVGKSPREIVEKGKFTWNDKNNTIILTPRDNSITRQYSVAENMLIQLDKDGNAYTGKIAERYVLRRNVMKESSQQHSAH